MAEAVLQIPDDHDYPAPDHIIIWLDTHIGRRNEYRKLKSAFSSNVDPRHQTWTMLADPDYENLLRVGDARAVLFANTPFLLLAFTDPDECYRAFEANRNKHIYFITSGTLGEVIIPRLIDNRQHLFKDPVTKKPYSSIYVFCGNTTYHYAWLFPVREYVLTFEHEDDLLARLARDVAENFDQQGQHCLEEALARYQRSKKVFTRYNQMGEVCHQQMKHVEKRMADIEKILKPHLVNCTTDESNVRESPLPATNNDDNDVPSSEPCS